MASTISPTQQPSQQQEPRNPTTTPAQPPTRSSSTQQQQQQQQQQQPPPPGLKALIDHCHSIYPDQPNPLQVTTLVKFWLGGQDPLDYISMYENPGDAERRIPPHWHYISFGISDLHGDERVHLRDLNEINKRSGMGFEITFRLLKTETELRESRANPGKKQRPPTWPANLLQAIARYCFRTGNTLCAGDNIPWRKSLDGSVDDISKLQNILIAQDPQFGSIETPFGTVEFCQIVGVTDEELEQASRWNGRGVLNFLQQDPMTGGEWLVTDMNRTLSVFELFPETLLTLLDDLEKQGSDLAGVNADFLFREVRSQKVTIKQEIDSHLLNEQFVSDENNPIVQQRHHFMEQSIDEGRYPEQNEQKQQYQQLTNNQIKREEPSFPQSMSMSNNSLHRSCPLDYQPQAPECISLEGIEIMLAPYAAKYLLLAVKDRIRHGRHFTFKAQHLALTFVAEAVTGSAVTRNSPYGVIGYWVQILIPDDLVPRMIEAFQREKLDDCEELKQRIEFDWPDRNLKIIVDQPKVMQMSIS